VPPCDQQVNLSADKEAPRVVMQSVDAFNNSARVFWTTNKPSNGSVLFSGINDTCAENPVNFTEPLDAAMLALNNGMYTAWHNVPIAGIAPDKTYFYKIMSCGQNDLCSISSCLNFTTPNNDTGLKVKMLFTPIGIPSDPMGNLSYEVHNGTVYIDLTAPLKAGLSMNKTFNKTLRFRNPQATLNWSITFYGVDFTRSRTFNLTGAFNISVNVSGKVQVGMDKNKFLDIAQGLGADKVKIYVPQPGVDLYRCDEGEDCQPIENYTSFDTSDTGSSEWDIPLGLGFSDFHVGGFYFNLQGAPSNVYLTYTNGTNLSDDGCHGENCAETDAMHIQFRQVSTGRRVAEFNISGSVDLGPGDGGQTEIEYDNVSTVVHRFSNHNKVYPYYDIYVVNLNNGRGVFVCRNATGLDDLDPDDCGGTSTPIVFGPGDIGTTVKEGVWVEFNETDYKIFNLSGSGAGLLYILNFSGTTYLEFEEYTGENYTIINVTNGESQWREYNFSLEIQGTDLNYTINGSSPTLDEINFSVDESIDLNVSFNDSVAGVRNVSLIGTPTDNETVNLNSSDDMGLIVVNVTEGPADTTPPAWDQQLANQTVEFGVAFVYDVNASDLSGIDTYFINDTSDFAINASNGNITNATALAVGVYHLNVSVNDTPDSQCL
jgi:hypothetical protein